MTIYIPPFVLGMITTLVAEVLFAIVLVKGGQKK